MNHGALAIFVKTPGHSPVKSRLAVDCGVRYAEQWYRRAAAAVAAVAQQAQARFGVHAYWAVAEPAALDADCWAGLPSITQGEGGLGERMAHVQAQLVARHGHGVLLGADAPQLSLTPLGEALQWLDAPQPRLALGPAADGGFWLFGANRAPPLAAWTSVRYSSSDTARALRESLDSYGRWRTLATLADADHRADLRAVLDALQALPEPLPEQRALADWMREQEGIPL
jgi:uncharacterized protein